MSIGRDPRGLAHFCSERGLMQFVRGPGGFRLGGGKSVEGRRNAVLIATKGVGNQ